jgi:sugar phosphate isomerase/epimerase
MLGFGTKKPPPLDRFPIEQWGVAKAEIDNRPSVLRINTGVRKYIAHPELPYRLGVIAAMNAPNDQGFCAPEEGQQLNQVEDRLTAALMANQMGFPVVVVTSGSRREFIFYVRDEDQAIAAVQSVLPEIKSHSLTHHVERDAEWSYYKQFVGGQ